MCGCECCKSDKEEEKCDCGKETCAICCPCDCGSKKAKADCCGSEEDTDSEEESEE